MYVYFDKNGNTKEIINDKPLRSGDVNVNKIYAYIDDANRREAGSQCWVRFTRPDGVYINIYNCTISTNEVEIPYSADRDLKYFEYYKGYKFYEIEITQQALDGIHGLDKSGTGSAVITFTWVEDNVGHSLTSQVITYNIERGATANTVMAEVFNTNSQFNYLLSRVTTPTLSGTLTIGDDTNDIVYNGNANKQVKLSNTDFGVSVSGNVETVTIKHDKDLQIGKIQGDYVTYDGTADAIVELADPLTTDLDDDILTVGVASASADNDGVMSASDYTKLSGIEAGAEVNKVEKVKVGATTINPASNKVVSITKQHLTDTIGVAKSNENGLMASTDKTKLDGLQAVSGTHNTTNWTALTIGTDSYNIPQGGGATYTYGDGIYINDNNVISASVGTGLFFDGQDRIALNNASQNAINAVAGKSTVSVSATGEATDEVRYITIDGVEKKIAGGGSGSYTFSGGLQESEGTVSVKVGVGLAVNDSGELYASGITIPTYLESATYTGGVLNIVNNGGQTVTASIQSPINSDNKLNADYVNDTNSTNKFVTENEKTTWNGKQNALTAGSHINITGSTISASFNDATTGASGLMSASDKTKLNGLNQVVGEEEGTGFWTEITIGNTTQAIPQISLADGGTSEEEVSYITLNGVEYKIHQNPQPTTYLKNAVINAEDDKQLIITKQDNSTVTFDATPAFSDITGNVADNSALSTALGGKQATLVSGTNIKTINNTSLLGSGNITISGSKPTWVNKGTFGLTTIGTNDWTYELEDQTDEGLVNGSMYYAVLYYADTDASYTTLPFMAGTYSSLIFKDNYDENDNWGGGLIGLALYHSTADTIVIKKETTHPEMTTGDDTITIYKYE